uniref:response regulator transcription factor n=1 Tax=Allofournierella sp. TaxID=1940256 RepID=UPI003AF03E08
MRILLVEDDEALRGAVELQLRSQGWQAEACGRGDDAEYYWQEGGYDAVLLDRMLPGLDGLTLLRRMRAGGDATPVLLLTALADIGARVDGLDAGADDYLPKPFDMRELLARVRALGRRAGAGA